MIKETISILTPLSSEILWKEKQKFPRVISQISQVFILVNVQCVFYYWNRSSKYEFK